MTSLRTLFLAPSMVIALSLSGCGGKDDRPGGGDGGAPSDGGGGGFDSGGGSSDAGVRADAGPPGDGGMCAMSSDPDPYPTHSVNEEFTDPPTCTGCPNTFTGTSSLDVGMIPAGETTINVSGASAGADRCEWWVIGGACGVTHGSLPVDPDGAGTFTATLPVFCGTNIIRVICENTAGRRVLVRRIEAPSCTGRDLRLTIAWDDIGDDWELHLIRPGTGTINSDTEDCTWTTCMGTDGLEWGVAGVTTDNPHKDVDDIDAFGPENIYLENAPDGTYDVMVEHWGTGAPSTGTIDVTIREATVAHLTKTMFVQQHVWHVGTVTFPGGTFTPIDTDTDCTASWRLTTAGCDLPIPAP